MSNATPSQKTVSAADVRAWANELSQPKAAPQSVSCSCGLESPFRGSLEEHAAKLFNAGWRAADTGAALCPECSDGFIRRVVRGSKGEQYTLRLVAGAWRCTCKGYEYRQRCKHADALEAELAAAAPPLPVCTSCSRERGDVVRGVCGDCVAESSELAEMEAAWRDTEVGQ